MAAKLLILLEHRPITIRFPPMMILCSLVVSLSVFGFAMLAIAVNRAPEGYEDELGFHHVC